MADARTDFIAARDLGAPTLRRLAGLELALLVSVALIGVLAPAGLRWDFANYYDAGHKVLAGEFANLYDKWARIDGGPPLGSMDFVSTPITAFLYAPLALLPPYPALVLFKLVGTAATALALWLVWRRVRPMAGEDEASQAAFAVVFVTMAALFQPFWSVYRTGGQVTPWVFLILVWGWLAHERGRVWSSAACFTAAVAIKPFLIPGFVFLALVSGRRYLAAAAVVGAAAAAASIAILGWPLHRVFLDYLAMNAGTLKVNGYNSALTACIDAALIPAAEFRPGARPPEQVAVLLTTIRLGLFGLWLAAAWAMRRWPAASRASLSFLLAMMLPVFVTPVAWEHYLVLLFPLLAWLAADARRAPLGMALMLAAIVALSVTRNFVVFATVASLIGDRTTPQLVAVALFNSATLTLTLVFLVVYRRPIAQSFAADAARAAPAAKSVV